MLLTDGTLLERNSAPPGGGGTTFIEDGSVIHYVLPAPLGRYISGIPCDELYAGTVESSYSPCGARSDHPLIPSMHTRTMERLPPQAVDYESYPLQCDIGLYGDRTDTLDQSRATCSGPCPEGSTCPSRGTVQPQRCRPGYFCPSGFELLVRPACLSICACPRPLEHPSLHHPLCTPFWLARTSRMWRRCPHTLTTLPFLPCAVPRRPL